MINPGSQAGRIGRDLAVMLLLLLAVLSLLFHGVFPSGHTLFSNDGPLGRLISACHQLPDRFTGCWSDLNSIGGSGGAAPTGISIGLQYLLKPIWFSKLYALLSLTILGVGAWCFFTQLRLAPVACILGGLAAALNSCFFSVAAWGVAAQAIDAGMFFFAMAALADPAAPRRWLRVVLAGFIVGMGVVEGSDVGAIYSLFIALYILYQAWLGGGSIVQRLTGGATRLLVVVVFAVYIASQAISSLVGTSIEGVVGTGQDEQTRASRWDWATQWSLPVEESLGLAVPGLFGYRMDTTGGGCYWGRVGEDPAVERFLANGRQGKVPRGFMRYSGGGFYAGMLVLLVGFWAGAQSLRGKASAFSSAQRPWLWFWLGVAFVSLLLAWGRYAPFYQFLYALPYFSTIRNPVKFTNFLSVALVVLFSYGLDGIWRLYLQPAMPAGAPRLTPLKNGAARPGGPEARSFDRLWLRAVWVLVGLGAVAWLKYATESQSLADYLRTVQFRPESVDNIANFSVHQAGWALLLLILATGLLVAVFAGKLGGARARWGVALLGLFLIVDLGRANLPWVVFWNYEEKYASNPVIDMLRDKPYEHRAVLLPGQTTTNPTSLSRMYKLEWLQQQFPFYNIQTLDVIEMPRVPADLSAFSKAFNALPNPTGIDNARRLWQVTDCRYVLAPADAFDAANQSASPSNPPFRIRQRFDIVPKPGNTNSQLLEDFTAKLDDNGPYALFEYMQALPRAKLFSHWEINTTNDAVLADLGNPNFDFGQTVVVSGSVPPPPPGTATNQNAGTVEFASYAPKDIVLKCAALTPAMLLLNDHFDPDWHVLVDGKPDVIARCNYIMRGVYLPPGNHTVEFKYQPPFGLMYVSLSAIGLALVVFIVVLLPCRTAETAAISAPVPAASVAMPEPPPSPAKPEKPVAPLPRAKPAAPSKPATTKKRGQTLPTGRRR
jgi:hypothetical protein